MVITRNYRVVVFNVSLEAGVIQLYKITLSSILILIVGSVAVYSNYYYDNSFRVKKYNHVN